MRTHVIYHPHAHNSLDTKSNYNRDEPHFDHQQAPQVSNHGSRRETERSVLRQEEDSNCSRSLQGVLRAEPFLTRPQANHHGSITSLSPDD